MIEALIGFVSAVLGAILGSCFAWHLARSTARNEARRNVLAKAMKSLQAYRVAYAQWYVEYLALNAGKPGSWAKQATGTPDPTYLDLMRRVDHGRGNLRVTSAMLYAHFPPDEAKRICTLITKLLVISAEQAQATSHDVDSIAENICNLIPDIIRKYV